MFSGSLAADFFPSTRGNANSDRRSQASYRTPCRPSVYAMPSRVPQSRWASRRILGAS
jgi:hypothetical protein